MKLAELFVAIGFQVEGPNVLPDIERDLDNAANKAGKLAVGIDLLTAGLLFMADHATNAAVALNKFGVLTGLSTTELQRWEHAAALFNVSGGEMAKTITSLQEVVPKMMMQGGSAAAPWFLLGLNPGMDPIKMLDTLSDSLKNVSKEQLALTRVMMHQAGFSDDVIQFLMQYNRQRDALKERYLLMSQEQGKLMQLNREWKNLTDVTSRASDKFIAEMAPALMRVVGFLTRGVDKLAEFIDWLHGGTPEADNWRHALQLLAVGIIALGGVLTTFVGIVKGASIVVGAFNAAAAPWVLTITALAAAVLAAADAYMVLTSAIKHFHDADPQKGLGTYDPSKPDGKGRAIPPRHNRGGIGPLDLLGNPVPTGVRSGNTTTIKVDKISVEASHDTLSQTADKISDAFSKALAFAGSNAPAQTV